MDNHPRGGRALKRPAISAPLNQKKIEKARAWVKATGQRWLLRDAKRLWLDLNPSRQSGVTQSWIWRRQLDGRTRDHGLGSWPETAIEDARALALDCEREFRRTKVSPIDARRREKSTAAVSKATQLTFGQAAEQFYRKTLPSWRSFKSASGWRATVLGTKPNGTPSEADWCRRLRPVLLADVNTPLIVAALEDRWVNQPATGPRVAQRIASVFAWAMARQLRQPPNPADWSVLSRALATPTRREPAHHAAMDWKALPGFFAELQRREGVAARALEFTILTAARTGEALGALWSEFSDLDGAAPTWTIPPARMKAGREHRVPLSRAAVALLTLPREPGNPLVFAATVPGKPMSPDSMLRVLQAMGHAVTAHGFRSAFSDFAHERTKAEPLLVEAALAHAAGNKIAKAYRRGDLFERRARLMEAWAAFLLSGEAETPKADPPGLATVVQLPLREGLP